MAERPRPTGAPSTEQKRLDSGTSAWAMITDAGSGTGADGIVVIPAPRRCDWLRVEPIRRVGRVELQIAAEQDGRDIRGSHGQAGMAGLCCFHRVHGECPDRIGHEVMGGARRWGVVPGRCGLILHEMLHSASVRDRIACAEIVSKRTVHSAGYVCTEVAPGGQRPGRR